ncbi:Cof-type HAD-IIB family hydrolase [Pseudalkalibacillus caeni]|nr:Cof-type HAD-IIB family hydrolase [Pseudalkalibacillus caeni]
MKCIAIDMDGTLLNEMQEVSRENIEAIQKAQQQGVTVVLATGRAYTGALRPLERSGLTLPAICYNGAEIRNEDGSVLASVSLQLDQVQQMKRTLEDNNIYYQVFTNNGIYTDDYEGTIKIIIGIMKNANPDMTREELVKGAEQQFEDLKLIHVTDYNEVLEQPNIEVYKLLSFSKDPALEKVREQIDQIENVVVTTSGYNNLEINHQNAQKGIALKNFTERKNIPLKQTMAVGDNYNDVSMFKAAGISAAMGNAEEEIQKMCTFITKSNEEHGVAHAIEKFLADGK